MPYFPQKEVGQYTLLQSSIQEGFMDYHTPVNDFILFYFILF